MKENFQIHIWLGLLLCLLGMSCSDDTPAKGNEPGNGNTELEVNEWIESVMRSDYLWNNDIPAQFERWKDEKRKASLLLFLYGEE